MKTKKLLSFMLAIAMVFSMMATLTVTASAEDANDKFAYTANYQPGIVESVPAEIILTFPNATSVAHTAADEDYMLHDYDYYGDGLIEKNQIMINGSEIFNPGTYKITVPKDYMTVDGDTLPEDIVLTYTILPIANLDLDSTTTDIKDSKDLDQNYNLTVNEGTKTDVTKVKLSWEINDINATRTDNKVWDAENLCWTTSTSSTEIKQAGTAKFTLENYSSVKVDATASFKAEEEYCEDLTS